MKKLLLIFSLVIFFFIFIPKSAYAFGECTSAKGNDGSCKAWCDSIKDFEQNGAGSCLVGNCCVPRPTTVPTRVPTPTSTPPTRLAECQRTTGDTYCEENYPGKGYKCGNPNYSTDDGCHYSTSNLPVPTQDTSCTNGSGNKFTDGDDMVSCLETGEQCASGKGQGIAYRYCSKGQIIRYNDPKIGCFSVCPNKNTSTPIQTCQCTNGKYSSACGEDAGTPCGDNTGGRTDPNAFQCHGQKVVQGDTVEYACNGSCSGDWKKSSQTKTSCGTGLTCCYKDIASVKKEQPTPKSGGGSGSNPTSAPNKKNNEEEKEPTATPKQENKSSKNSKRDYIDCNPGDAVGTDEKACPKGKKGTCGGHYYCVWSEEGNYKSDFKCETEKDTCSDKDQKEESSKESSCKDNPTSPPDGYTWKNSCKSCGSNDDCPQNTKDNAVNPDTSNWCYGGKCLMMVSGGSSSKNDKKNDEKKSSSKKKEDDKKKKDKDKKKDDDKKKKDKNDGKTKDDTGNRNKNHSKQDKSDRDKAQKAVDEQNKKLAKQGKPTLTPLPPDNGAYEAYLSSTPNPTSGTRETPTPTITPTPQPPLAEPGNWQGFCAQTTDSTRPWGIKISWDTVGDAPRYAVRIDEDAPSWEGDTPSPGDTVDNQVTTTYYVREAKPGATYQWWVHSINKGGVYSTLTKKMIIKCPSLTNTTATPPPQSFGAGQLIVLPNANSPTPTITPTPKK